MHEAEKDDEERINGGAGIERFNADDAGPLGGHEQRGGAGAQAVHGQKPAVTLAPGSTGSPRKRTAGIDRPSRPVP